MNLFGKVTRASLYLAAAFGTAFANATENMPGGPAVNQLNFAAPATKIMQEIHWLHWMMLVICALIFVGVFGVMFYSILKHRKSLGHKSASFHESTLVEIIWTVIPLLIGAALLGDQVNYFIGKYFSNIIREREKVLFLKREHIEETEAFYAKYGPKTVILARFIPIVRTVAPFVAGAGRMSYMVYLLYGFLGAALWVSSISAAGYFLGDNEFVKANFEKVVLGIVGVSVLPILWGLISKRK